MEERLIINSLLSFSLFYNQLPVFIWSGILILALFVFFINLVPLDVYAQGNDQIISGFKLYENDIDHITIQYPSNWEQAKKLPPDSIVKLIAPDTVGPTKETGLLISIFQRPNDNNLDEFIDFFQKNRYIQGRDFTLVNSSESTLAGLKARNIIMYEQQENVSDPKSDLKVMRTYAFDNYTHKGYTIRYYSEPGLFNRYLPIAQKIIGSFEITNRTFVPALVNNTENNASNIPEDKNNTKPFVRPIAARNNTVNLASIIIERGSSFPDNARFYNPTNLTIQGNTTVIWTNNDTVLHTVTSGNPQIGPSKFFDSSLIQPDTHFNHTFTKVGNFEYYCTLHPFMKGMITVTKQIKPLITVLPPGELPSKLNVSIAEGSSFPGNGKFFVPAEVSIGPNGTIVWTNDDKIIHTVTSGKPREGPSAEFDSGIIRPGDKFNHTFLKTGTYDYYSNLHPYMIGKVIVGFYSFNLQVDDRIYPISFLLKGDGNLIQKISLQTTNPLLEIRLVSTSAGNLTLVIPRILLDKLDQNGKDDAFGVIGNRAVGFEETSTTPASRTLGIQFEPGVNYIQILGTKSIGYNSTGRK